MMFGLRSPDFAGLPAGGPSCARTRILDDPITRNQVARKIKVAALRGIWFRARHVSSVMISPDSLLTLLSVAPGISENSRSQRQPMTKQPHNSSLYGRFFAVRGLLSRCATGPAPPRPHRAAAACSYFVTRR